MKMLHREPGPRLRTRVAVLGILGALGAGVAVVGNGWTRDVSTALPAVSATAENRAWFCPVTLSNGEIRMRNQGVNADATLIAVSADASTERDFKIIADQLQVTEPDSLLEGATIGVSVVTPRDGVEVAHRYSKDVESIRCQSKAETHLVFPNDTTGQGARLALALFNPFFDPAVVDVTFQTDVGTVTTNDMQGIVVNPRSLRIVETSSEIPRREWVTTVVTTRSGRVAANSIQTPAPPTEGSGGRQAPAFVSVPAPDARTGWFSPPSDPKAEGPDILSIVNTEATEVGVQVSVSAAGHSAIEPFVIRVPAEGIVRLDLKNERRIPADAPLEIRVDGQDGAEVIATRTAPGVVPGYGAQRWNFLQER